MVSESLCAWINQHLGIPATIYIDELILMVQKNLIHEAMGVVLRFFEWLGLPVQGEKVEEMHPCISDLVPENLFRTEERKGNR